MPGRGVLRSSFGQLATTFREIRKYRQVVRFLVARLVFNDGLVTIFAFGGIYAQGTFDFTVEGVGYQLVALQLVGSPEDELFHDHSARHAWWNESLSWDWFDERGDRAVHEHDDRVVAGRPDPTRRGMGVDAVDPHDHRPITAGSPSARGPGRRRCPPGLPARRTGEPGPR